MSYPTPSEYQDALQDPASAFDDPTLQAATPRTNVLGLPQPITGAFAAVFPVTTESGRTVGIKCFLHPVGDQQERYTAIASHLQDADLDATIAFDYRPSGIRVRGDTYPILRMEWVEGTTLRRFVEAHRDAPDVLRRLADRWMQTVDALEAASVAHGDLQHGNVLVQATDDALSIRLVDYDTMYVPALRGRRAAEVGHRNYQHPDRTEDDFGPYVDRFAALVISTALRACAERPALWDRFDTGENLLFRDADFYAPDASPLFDALAEVEAIAPWSDVLRRACVLDPEQVPALTCIDADTAGAMPGGGLRRPRRRTRDAAGRSRDRFERVFLPVGVSVIAISIMLAGVGITWGGGALAVGAAAGATWAVRRRYSSLPTVRRRRRLATEIERLTERIDALQRQLDSLQDKRRQVLATIDEQRAERLQEVQDEALRDRLKHHFVGEAREVDGITHKHVVCLKAADIRTAHEATAERVASIRRLGEKATARLQMWRSSLVNTYEDEIPEALSPAEERRLQRYVQHRVEDIDDDIARTTEKVEAQSVERDRLRERRDDLPSVSLVRYLRYLCRLGDLPDRSSGPPAPSQAETDPGSERDADPLPTMSTPSDDRWWQ